MLWRSQVQYPREFPPCCFLLWATDAFGQAVRVNLHVALFQMNETNFLLRTPIGDANWWSLFAPLQLFWREMEKYASKLDAFFFFFRKFYRHCNQRGILQCFFRRQRKTCLRLKTKPGQIWTVGRLCILVLEQGNLIKRSAETSERNCVHAVFDPMRMLENSDLWHLYLMPCL